MRSLANIVTLVSFTAVLSACGSDDPAADPFGATVGGNVLVEVVPSGKASLTSAPLGITCDAAWARLPDGSSDPDDRSGCRFGFLAGNVVTLQAETAEGATVREWEIAEGQLAVGALRPGTYAPTCGTGTSCTLPEIEVGDNYFVRLNLDTMPSVPATPDGSNLLVDAGFESLEYRTGVSPVVPNGTGYWQGDQGTIVEGTQADGVSPDEGSRMLRCNASGPFGGAVGYGGCELFQIVDVSQYAELIDDAALLVSASMRVNRVDLDAETDTDFRMRIFALAGPPSEAPTAWSAPIERWDAEVTSDGDTATWEEVSITNRLLPSGTRTVMLMLSPIENVFDDGGADEFDGHYMDRVSLSIIQR